VLQAQSDALVRAIPEWKDPEAAKAGKAKVAQYLRGKGYTDQQINTLVDHRVVVMAHKALQSEQKPKQGRRPPPIPGKKQQRASSIDEQARKRNVRNKNSLEYGALRVQALL